MGKYGPEKPQYLETFHVLYFLLKCNLKKELWKVIYRADLKRHWNRSIEFETFEGFFLKKGK